MSDCLVSVIIPARNEGRLLGQTLDSVISSAEQLHDWDYEVIVVDNASSDGTEHVLRQYSAQAGVRSCLLQRLGAGRARNFGRDQALGRVLVFLDADTQISPDSLTRIVKHCEQGGIQAGITRLDGLEGGLRSRAWWFFWEQIRRLPLAHAKAMPALMFCTSSAFDEFGPFDEDVAIGEEWPILASVYRRCPQRFIYDRSLTARSSNRRMEQQAFGYARTLLKYVWAVLHRSGRIRHSDRIR